MLYDSKTHWNLMFSKCFKVSGNCTCFEYYHTSFVLDCLVAKLLMGIPKQMSTLRFQGIIEVGWDLWYQVQPLLLEQVTQSRLPRMCPLRFWADSKGGDATTSVGNLLQCLTTVVVKKFSLCSDLILFFCNLCPLPLVLPEVLLRRAQLPLLHSLPSGVHC